MNLDNLCPRSQQQLPSVPSDVGEAVMAGEKVMMDCTRCGASCQILVGLDTSVTGQQVVLLWPVHEDADRGRGTAAERRDAARATTGVGEAAVRAAAANPRRMGRSATTQDIDFMEMLDQKEWYWVLGSESARLRRKNMSPADKAEALTWVVRQARFVAGRLSARCSSAPDGVAEEAEAMAARPEAWALSQPLCQALLKDLRKLGRSWPI